ncbi:hypothetical protein [Rodentibacter caecimuris]|nr:hypothetical protein [Rodentibacter heylii]
MREFSLGNSVNAKDIRITATEGDIRAKQTDFTSRDSEGKWQADSRNCVEIFFDSTTTEAKLFSGLPLREAVFIVKVADFFNCFHAKHTRLFFV